MNNWTTYIGIDPGLKGGIGIISPDGQVYTSCMVQTGDDLDVLFMKEWIERSAHPNSNIIAYIEVVHSMPEQGVSSSFKFGYVTGMIRGMIRTMDIPLFGVTPQAWKKEILAGTDKSKQAAIDFCLNAFPKANLFATERSRKYHDGIADSLCLAEYGRRHYTRSS